MYNSPYMRPSLFGRALNATKTFNFSSFLDGTQKTLGIINQAIPIVYQVKPMIQNAKTMFRIADEIRKPMDNSSTTSTASSVTNVDTNSKNRPVFYI